VDVWTYFEQKEKEFASLSLEPEEPPPGQRIFAEADGSDGKRGRILANLILAGSPVDADIAISEKIVVRGQRIHREEYAYFLVIDGEEVMGYERDLSHSPPVHAHTTEHVRTPAGRIAFKRFAALAWEEVSGRGPDQD
jgi:hypothetical protein